MCWTYSVRISELHQASREKSRKTKGVFLVALRGSGGKSKSLRARFLFPVFSFGEAKEKTEGQPQIYNMRSYIAACIITRKNSTDLPKICPFLPGSASCRLQGGKFAVLLLIPAEEAADGQQDEGSDGEGIDRQRDRPCAFREELLDSDSVQQDADQQPVRARDIRAEQHGAHRDHRHAQRQLRRVLCAAFLRTDGHEATAGSFSPCCFVNILFLPQTGKSVWTALV